MNATVKIDCRPLHQVQATTHIGRRYFFLGSSPIDRAMISRMISDEPA